MSNQNSEAENGASESDESLFAAEAAKAAKPAEAATAAKPKTEEKAEEGPSGQPASSQKESAQPVQGISAFSSDARRQPASFTPEPQTAWAPPSGEPVQTAYQPDSRATSYQPAPAASPYASAPSGYSPETDPVRPYSSYTQGGTNAQAGGKGNGTAALVCGILAIAFCGLPIVGVILGIVALALAAKTIKRSGKNGKTTAGKVCGIIGLVLSILMLVVGLALAAWSVTYLSDLEEWSDLEAAGSAGALNQLFSDGNAGSDDEEVAEAAARKAVEQKLDALVNGDAAEIAAIANLADSGFYEQIGLTLSDVGVDADEYARWITDGMSYRIDNVVCGDEVISYSSEENGTATVYVYITTRDVFAFLDDLGTLVDEFAVTPEANAISSNEEAAVAMGDLFRAAMAASSHNDYTTNYAMFTLTKSGSSWVIDQGDWDYEIDYMFGLA